MREPLTKDETERADDMILAMGAQLTEACKKGWVAYLKLPWLVQRRLEEIRPELARELKRRHFGLPTFDPER